MIINDNNKNLKNLLKYDKPTLQLLSNRINLSH